MEELSVPVPEISPSRLQTPAPQGSFPVSDTIILGAGIAGLTAADRILDAGASVLVIEASSRCGGTHNSVNIGPYTFDYGSIFYEEGAAIFALGDGLAEQCPEVRRHQRRIAPNGKLLHYPLEPRDMLRAPPLRLIRNVLEMLASRLLVKTDGSLAAIMRKYMGRGFCADTGLEYYAARFNHTPPELIHERFFYQRMGFVQRFTRLGNLLRVGLRSLAGKSSFSGQPRKRLRVRPVGGFDELFRPIQQRLTDRGATIALGTKVEKVERQGDLFIVETDQGTFGSRSLVSAIPLDTLHRALFGQGSGLDSIDLLTLFVSAEWLDPDAGNVLCNFHRLGRWKRATIYSRIYPASDTDREFFSLELTLAPGEAPDPEAALADFAAHAEAIGFARGLKLEGHAVVEAAYPHFSLDFDTVHAAAQGRVAETGVICVGRQGRFEYLPTSTGVIRRTREELARSALASEVANPE